MVKGVMVFLAGARLLWQYRAFALRMGVPLFGLVFAVNAFVRLQVFGHLGVEQLQLHLNDPYADLHRMTFGQGFMTVASWAACLVTAAVLWHRHILREQLGPGLQPLGAAVVLRYAVKLAGIWALFFGIFFVFVVMLITPAIMASTPDYLPMMNQLLVALITAFMLVLGYVAIRISLILPAAAVGMPASIGASWTATQPLAGPLWVVAALEFATMSLSGFAGEALSGLHGGLAWLVSSVLYAGALMLGLSILTWLYGELHEDLG